MSACGTWACRKSDLRGRGEWDLARIYASLGKKTTENSGHLHRQARPEIEPGTSRLPALSADPLRHWWGQTDRIISGKKQISTIFYLYLLNVFVCALIDYSLKLLLSVLSSYYTTTERHNVIFFFFQSASYLRKNEILWQ